MFAECREYYDCLTCACSGATSGVPFPYLIGAWTSWDLADDDRQGKVDPVVQCNHQNADAAGDDGAESGAVTFDLGFGDQSSSFVVGLRLRLMVAGAG